MPEWATMIAFFLAVYVVYAGFHVYAFVRIVKTSKASRRVRRIVAWSMAVLGSLYLIGRGLGQFVGWHVGLVILWPGSVWLGYFSLLLSLLLVVDFLWSLPSAIGHRVGWIGEAAWARCRSWTRRVFVGLPIAALLLSGVAVMNAVRPPDVTRLEVILPGLAERMDGFRIVHLSDLHAGALVTPSMLERLVGQVNALQPDLVVITGDLGDEEDGGDGRSVRIWGGVQAPHGVLAVTGNHEYYSGGETVVQTLSRAGIRFLRQEHVLIDEALVVAGVDDPAMLGGRGLVAPAITRALTKRPPALPTLLLSHQPMGVAAAAEAGVDLMLSGHTHAGQIPPYSVLSRLAFRHFAGWYEIKDMRLYVSRGAGFWGPPMRLMADAEVVLITLRSAGGDGDGT